MKPMFDPQTSRERTRLTFEQFSARELDDELLGLFGDEDLGSVTVGVLGLVAL